MPAADGPAPLLSAVLVSRGAADLTRRSLAALRANTEVAWEAIVVDNASDEDTRTALSQLPDVQIVLNDLNIGFGPASNQGARLARGRYLLLLNSDAFVHPGWFAPLAAALADEQTAAVVPKLLNVDSTLQEAGVLLARDGGVRLYGDGDSADAPRYDFRRYVDAGSAAVMLLEREDFLGLDGFDDAFAPAYYEDADLCMRIGAAGQRVIYEPASIATHVRYGSSNPESARTLSEGNRQRFTERWATRLADRPVSFDGASRQALLIARDADAYPRVLMCLAGADPAPDAVLTAGRLADRLLTHWPQSRLTCMLGDHAGGATELSAWVERASTVEPEWLEDRLCHYDVVVLAGTPDPGLDATLLRTQPYAERIALAALEGISDSGLLARFAVAGVLSPAVTGRYPPTG